MNWLKARLREKSTYAGTIVTAYAVAQLGPELGVLAANFVIGAAGVVLAVKADG